jgi:hypothetical protein
MENIEQYSHAYMVRNYHLDIEAPPKAIWPLLIEFERFNQTFERVEVLSGKRDEVGSLSLLVKQQGEWCMPPYLVKIIRLVPERQIVWKMLPQEGQSYVAFVDFSLTPEGSLTRFLCNVYTEALVPRMSDASLKALEAKMAADYEKLEGHVFPTLKRLAEGMQGGITA